MAAIQGWEKLVSDLVADPAIVYEQSGLDSSDLIVPDGTLPTHTAANLLALAAETSNCPHFGLMLAKRRDLNSYFGLLGQIVHASANIGMEYVWRSRRIDC